MRKASGSRSASVPLPVLQSSCANQIELDLAQGDTACRNRVLLVNSVPLRARTLGDSMLENSIAILKTYLRSQGVETFVWDSNRIDRGRSAQSVAIARELRAMISAEQ